MHPLFLVSTCIYAVMLAHLAVDLGIGGVGGFTMFGAPAGVVLFVYYVLTWPTRSGRWALLASGVLLEAVRVQVLRGRVSIADGAFQNNQSINFGAPAPVDEAPATALDLFFSLSDGFGIALGIAVTGAIWLRAVRPGNHILKSHVGALMLAQVFLIYSMTLVSLVSWRGMTYDTELHNFETTLGVYVPAVVGRVFQAWPSFAALSRIAYATLAAGVLGGYLIQTRQKQPPPVNLLAASGIAACASFIYFLVPGCGPLELFGSRFPNDVPLTDYHIYTDAPDPSLWRNAMPSLHSTWALLLAVQLFSFHPSRVVGWLSVGYSSLVIAATLGTGAHYFVDIVVALPLTLLVQALASVTVPWSSPTRQQAAAAGASMIVVWLVLLCLFPAFFGFTTAWGMILGTAILCGALLHRLIRVTRTSPLPEGSPEGLAPVPQRA
jgi:hypothetical protein